MAKRYFRIPLVAKPQRFAITLAGRALIFVCRWNPEMESWSLDILDGETELPLILCLPIVAGIDLLSQHKHLGIEGKLGAFTSGDLYAPPTFTNLGAEGNLYYVVEN